MLTASNAFGDLLRQLRRRAGMTQADLAAAVGFSEGQISRLESNQRLPDLTLIAQVFLPALSLQEEPQLALRLVELAALARGERPPTELTITRQTRQVVQEEATSTPRHLPHLPTALIGRQREIESITNRFVGHAGRLLTLLGPPGVGKTSLSLAVAAQLQHLYADGARFIRLASVTDPAQVAPAILAALEAGKSSQSAKPPRQRLIERLRRKQMLLVLDNFEQIVAAAPLVGEILAECPGIHLLVTSRERLHLRAEQRYRVQPLDQKYAIELFVQCARAVEPEFTLQAQSRATITQICQRLDCLPLAIELAAAHSSLFTPEQLLEQLKAPRPTRLRLLTGGARDLPPRQRTLRRAITWSYDLLAPREQILLARLGVFVGGFSLEAAAAVGNEERLETGDRKHEQSLLSSLQSLIDKSLVQRHPHADELRFALLETIREFALERLSTLDAAQTRRHHAAYFLTFAEQAAQSMVGREKKAWLDRLERDYNNLRTALRWLIGKASEEGLQLAGALGEFWYTQGHHSEGRDWLAQALRVSPTPTVARVRALRAAGQLAHQQSDHTAALQLIDESLAIAHSLNDQAGIAAALRERGWITYDLHDVPEAIRLFEESLRIFRTLDDQSNIANLLAALAHVIGQQGIYNAGVNTYLQESLAIYRALDQSEGIALVLHKQGALETLAGNYPVAATRMGEALTLYRTLGDKHERAWVLVSLGEAEWLQQQYASARAHQAEAQALFQEMGEQWGFALSLYHLGQIERREGNLEVATHCYQQSLQLFAAMENRHMIARCLAGLGGVALALGQFERAGQLLGGAQQLFAALPPFLAPGDREEYEQMIDQGRIIPGEQDFVEAFNRGAQMGLEQAITYALD